MKKIILLMLLPIISLTGCSVNTELCDPNNANLGILDKMNCNFSGSYEQRIEQKQQILLDEQKTNKQFKEIYASIEKQKNDSSLTLSQKQAEQKKLANELTRLSNEIKQKAASRQDLQDQISDIDKQLNKVNNSSTSEMEKQIELDKLNNKLQNLQKALNL